MFASIRRHQKWLWMLISAAVIISFVVFFTPHVESHLLGRGGSGQAYGVINGRSIGHDEAQHAFMEARLRYFLFNGGRGWPDEDPSSKQFFNDERETQTRLFLLEKIGELGIRPDEKAVVAWIQDAFKDTTGAFRKESFDQFLERSLKPRGYTLADVFTFATHEVALQHLVNLAGIPGALVTPREAEQSYRAEHEQVTCQAVFFNVTNYLATVSLDPLAISQFFTNQSARYRIPEKTIATYVRFDAAPHLEEAEKVLTSQTNLAALVQSIYQQRGTNFYVDEASQPLPPNLAQERIREELKLNQAMLAARRLAIQFVEELMEQQEKQPAMSGHLERLAPAKGYSVQTTSPFDFSGTTDPDLPPTFARSALSLSADTPFTTQPILGTNAVFVAGFKSKIPSEIPPFDSVRERVTEDYRRSQALDVARLKGSGFHSAVTNGLAAGKTFEALAAEAQLSVTTFPPFAVSARSVPEIESHTSFTQFKDAIENVPPGKASTFIRTSEGGFVAMVTARQPVDAETLKRELPAYMAELRHNRLYDAFNEWFRKERERAGMTFASQSSAAK